MPTTLDKIKQHFPHSTPREGQLETVKRILDAFDSGKKFVMLEAPTGSGKSAIGLAVSKFYENSYYITSQKILQSQITRDYVDGNVVDLKGRNAYPCTYWDTIDQVGAPDGEVVPPKPYKYVSCAEGVCKTRDDASKCGVCTTGGVFCPYWKRVGEAMASKTAVMNFKAFLFQTRIENRFGPRTLLIIDEMHTAESQLLDHIAIKFIDSSLGIKFPKLESAAEYAEFLVNNEIEDIINDKMRLAKYANDMKAVDEWNSYLFKVKLFLESDHSEWISHWYKTKTGASSIVELKPIFIRDYADKYLFSRADKVLMMSATILDPVTVADSLGVKSQDLYSYRLSSKFPVENRPILFEPAGPMSFKHKAETLPKLAKKIEAICKKHGTERGIIHTHSFELANYIIDNLPREITDRFKFQNNYHDKEDLIRDHSNDPNSIIIAPAMHEGLDLKDDLARFGIICKVPFPSIKDNPQLEARMSLSDKYYDWLTALKLVQSCGRTTRSETDWSTTYIIDSDFKWFYSKTKKILPTWFSESIHW